MLVLNRLWRGDLSPSQNPIRKGSEYETVLSRLCEMEDRISKGLTEQGKKDFTAFTMTQSELSSIESEAVFIEGFRMGAQMMLDAIGDYRGDFET